MRGLGMPSPATGEIRDPATVITKDRQNSSKISVQGRLAQIRVDAGAEFCKRLTWYFEFAGAVRVAMGFVGVMICPMVLEWSRIVPIKTNRVHAMGIPLPPQLRVPSQSLGPSGHATSTGGHPRRVCLGGRHRHRQMAARKLRCYIWKQWGGSGYRELRKRGVSVQEAWNTSKSAHGPWRLSKTPALSLALPARVFSNLGLPSLAG